MLSTAKERLLKKKNSTAIAEFFADGVSPKFKDLRPLLACLMEEIHAAHKKGASGYTICHCISDVVDTIFTELYKIFAEELSETNSFELDNFCIVALGGYARRELCPRSDIDIMFLYSSNKVPDSFKEIAIDEIMYPFWNLGYKLGHSSRTLEEAIEEANKDILTKTSMLDCRFLCGSKRVFDMFSNTFSAMSALNADTHILELLRLKTTRHRKLGWSPYVQEPNIKNGVGGLRDFQTLLWVSKLKLGKGTLLELAKNRVISASEYKILRRAYNFLLRVRNEMHFRAGRENDLLDLELQPKIAYALGFRKRNIVERVEIFMREVYYALREIDSSSKAARKRMRIELTEDIEESMGINRNSFTEYKYLDGFIIKEGQIYAQNSNIFRDDPRLIIKLFVHCQTYGVMPSDELEILIRDSVHLIDEKVINDKSANDDFLEIIRSQWDVFPILLRMHFLEVLGKFIPEFDELTCLVQHEFYHRYTADIHTLNSIKELDKIFGANVEDYTYGYYHAIISDTSNSTLLYIALLLHDIGKSDGIRGHAEVGAEIAEPILKRMGLPEEDIETVIFLIANHLMMARYWQTNDIEDEKVIKKFADMVGDEEKLKYLYVLTFCDAKATSEELWNSYKQTLHTMLYKNTLRFLQKDEEQIKELYEERRQRALNAIMASEKKGTSEEEALEHFVNLPRNYFLLHSRSDLILHMNMVHIFRERMKASFGNPMPVIDWSNDPNQSLSTVTIVTQDVKGLYYKLAGAFTYAGLNILGSKALSRGDGIIIDTFYITAVGGGAVQNEKTRELFSTAIEKIFVFGQEIITPPAPKKDKNELVPHSITIGKQDDKIVLEVIAKDRPGLLYSITKKIYEFGYDITFARISAADRWGSNTFHLRKTPATPADAESRLEAEMVKVL